MNEYQQSRLDIIVREILHLDLDGKVQAASLDQLVEDGVQHIRSHNFNKYKPENKRCCVCDESCETKRCSGCLSVRYCSTKCQQFDIDINKHGLFCKTQKVLERFFKNESKIRRGHICK